MNKNPLERQVLNLPAGYFGMVLGTIGMGFAWRYASTLWPVSRAIGDGLVALATMIWALLTIAFISRAIRFPGRKIITEAAKIIGISSRMRRSR